MPPKFNKDKTGNNIATNEPQNFLYLDPHQSNYSYNLDSFLQRYPSQDDLQNFRGDSYQYFNEPNFIFSRQATFNPVNYDEPPTELNKLHTSQTSFKNLLRSNSNVK
jgi:hypothetical protein